jgi:hypothetical protein
MRSPHSFDQYLLQLYGLSDGRSRKNLNPDRPNDLKPSFKVTRFPELAEQTRRSPLEA